MFEPSVGKLLVIVLIVLLFSGGNKMVDLARNLGRSVNEFKKGMREIDTEVQRPLAEAKEAVQEKRV